MIWLSVFFSKGEQDLAAAAALAGNLDISDDIVGFHCQQAVEKFLKAVLVKNEVVFRKTHDLIELTELLEDKLPLPENRDALGDLGSFAVTARYDFFDEPISFNRRQALLTVHSVRDWTKNLL